MWPTVTAQHITRRFEIFFFLMLAWIHSLLLSCIKKDADAAIDENRW